VSASFEESCARFSKFLSDNGYSPRIVWITPEDVLFTGRPLLYVKLPTPPRNSEQARMRFDVAMKEQSGVSFRAFCQTDYSTLCTVWVPADESERERAMCSKTDLKMSAAIGESRFRGEEVRSRFRWCYLSLRHKGEQLQKDQLFWG
jgi:hypothetical protein